MKCNRLDDGRSLAQVIVRDGKDIPLTYIGSGSTCIVYRGQDGYIYKEFAPIFKNAPMSERTDENAPLEIRGELGEDARSIYSERRDAFFCEAELISRLKFKYDLRENNMFIVPSTVESSLGACQCISGLWGSSLEKIYSDMGELSDVERLTQALTHAINLFSLISLYHSDSDSGDHGIVHLDIKPQNLFAITSDGEYVALRNVDFGSATDISTLLSNIRACNGHAAETICSRYFASSRMFYNYDRIESIIKDCTDPTEPDSEERTISNIRTLDLVAAWKSFLFAFDLGREGVLSTASVGAWQEREILRGALDGIFDGIIRDNSENAIKWYSVYCELCRIEMGIFADLLEYRASAADIASRLRVLRSVLIEENASACRNDAEKRLLSLNKLLVERASELIPADERSLADLNAYCDRRRIPYRGREGRIVNARARERIDLGLLADIEYADLKYSIFEGGEGSTHCEIPIIALYDSERVAFPLLITSEGGQGKTTASYILQAELLCRGVPCCLIEGKNVTLGSISASNANCISGSVLILDSWDELRLSNDEKKKLGKELCRISEKGVKVIVTSKYAPRLEDDIFKFSGSATICEFTGEQIIKIVRTDIGKAPRLYALLSNTMCMSIYMSLPQEERAEFADVNNTYQFLSQYFRLTFKNKGTRVSNPERLFADIGEQIYLYDAKKPTDAINLATYTGLFGIVYQGKTKSGWYVVTSHSKYRAFFLASYIKSLLGRNVSDLFSLTRPENTDSETVFNEALMSVGETLDTAVIEEIRRKLTKTEPYNMNCYFVLLGANDGCVDDEFFCLENRTEYDYSKVFNSYVRSLRLHYDYSEFEIFAKELINLETVEIDESNTHISSDGNCIISKYDNSLIRGTGSSIIPPYVTKIGDHAFLKCKDLKSIDIPYGVKEIGSGAFDKCEALRKVHIPDSVEIIGSFAFMHCTSLARITIPKSIKHIGVWALPGCTSLKNVYYQGSLEDWCKIKFDFYDSNPCYNSANLYINGELLVNAVIPDSVTSIGNHAFSGCTSLTSVAIPDSVTSIGWYAFRGCTSLTSVTIPDSVTEIGSDAFYYCTSLKYNEYDNAYYLGNSGNPYLVLVKAKSTDITSCDINLNTKFIYSNAFSSCKSLTSVTIPDSVTSIGSGAFYYCTSLTSITIPDCVTRIGGCAFGNCTSLTSITIPDSVRRIDDVAFEGCYSLKNVTILGEATSMGEDVFSRCDSVESVNIPYSLRYTIMEAFPIGKDLIDGHYDDYYYYYSDFKIHTYGWKPSYLLKDIYEAIKSISALLALLPTLLYAKIKSKLNK